MTTFCLSISFLLLGCKKGGPIWKIVFLQSIKIGCYICDGSSPGLARPACTRITISTGKLHVYLGIVSKFPTPTIRGWFKIYTMYFFPNIF
jgi:hypothetical protein